MLESGKKKYANVILNNYAGLKELIVYKNIFEIPPGCSASSEIDRARKFFYNENGHLQPKNIEQTNLIETLQSSLNNSRKRSLDKLYGYALSNKWNYFVTLTFRESEKYNRLNNIEINYCWQLFRQKMQYYFPNIKIIAVHEGHKKDGAIHFHCVYGNVDLKPFLEIATNNNVKSKDYGKPLKTKFGYQIYNFKNDFYGYGFSTVVEITSDTPAKKVINYLVKYISKNKDTNVRYNKKSYYCTKNLQFKEKEILLLTKEHLNELLNSKNLLNEFECVKDTDKFTIYTYKD